jgi:hypothetical protein
VDAFGLGETSSPFSFDRTERRDGGGVGRADGAEKKNESLADVGSRFTFVGVVSAIVASLVGAVRWSVCARSGRGGRGRGNASAKKECVLEFELGRLSSDSSPTLLSPLPPPPPAAVSRPSAAPAIDASPLMLGWRDNS